MDGVAVMDVQAVEYQKGYVVVTVRGYKQPPIFLKCGQRVRFDHDTGTYTIEGQEQDEVEASS